MDAFAKKMVFDVDVFDSLVERRVFRQIDGCVVIAKDRCGAGQRKAYVRE